jgi:glucose-1-phosphate adenylyltransferase
MDVMTLILAGGRERRLSILAAHRAKPALPFAGKYRIIDWALSNCVNSGLHRAALLPDYRAQTLLDHVGLGGPWDLNRRRPNGLFIWQPFRDEYNEDRYRGTAGALFQNRRRLLESDCDVVLVLSGDQVYTMDYRPLLEAHRKRRADATIAVVPVPPDQTYRFGMVQYGDDGRVTEFEEKPQQSTSQWGSMGVYVFSTKLLLDLLETDGRDPASAHDIGANIVPRLVEQHQVYAHPFDGYWQDVGTLPIYWRAQLDLLNIPPPLMLNNERWLIRTRSEERAPVKLLGGARAERSLISNGCVIEGEVINSVLSPGVHVAQGAVVRDSVVMLDSRIGAGAVVDRCVVDERVVVGSNARLGVGDDDVRNRTEPRHYSDGISVIGYGAQLPDGIVVGRHCRIDPEIGPDDLPSLEIASGTTVMHMVAA